MCEAEAALVRTMESWPLGQNNGWTMAQPSCRQGSKLRWLLGVTSLMQWRFSAKVTRIHQPFHRFFLCCQWTSNCFTFWHWFLHGSRPYTKKYLYFWVVSNNLDCRLRILSIDWSQKAGLVYYHRQRSKNISIYEHSPKKGFEIKILELKHCPPPHCASP